MPLYFLLLLYLIGVGIFLMATFFNLYHIFRFGFFDFTGKLNTFLFVGFSLIIFVATTLLLLDTPWMEEISFQDFLPYGLDQGLGL